jgi:PAS domain S-box-containing protein
MLGFEEDEIEASLEEWKNRVHKDDLERVFSDVRDYLDDKSDKYVNTHRVLSKDGSYKWILDRGVAVERDSFGRPTRMVGTHTDITRDKEILEKLENSENRLRNLLEISPIAVRIAKKHGKKVVFANQTYKKLINLQNEKVVRENPQNYYANREVYENIVARIENCETISNELVELKIPNSETQWALATYTQIEFEGEEAVLGWFFDVTESKKLEDNLIEAREEAENANRAKGDFLANMSHEIRTPLNGVIGLVDLTLQTDLTNTQQEFLEKAKTSSKALLNVLNDILDYSKVEAGKLDLEEREFSLKELLETVVSLFGYRAEEKGISLKYEISENVPEILNGDSLRLSQVLNNLVGNGIKFTKEGGVLIRVSKSCDESDHFRLNFEIKDSGIGISEEKQKRLFQAFSQADTSHTREYGGTGLGLAISKQIVALFGGEISVKSVDGEGSNFSFNAIFSKADNMNKKETILIKDNSIDISLLENKRVLLVEDNEINQLVATKNLEKFKMKISVANNGKEALDKISKDSFDIILMDIQMPIMDGFEATKRIREEFSKDQLPIIAMSAAVMKEDKDLAEKVGMNDHLSKPFKVEDLQRILLKWLNLDSLKVTDFEHFDEENSLEENDIIIDFEKGIEFLDGDDELFRDLLFGFRDKYENIGDEVQKSLEENDFENAKKTLHTLKGLSGQICATSLNIEVQKLEKLVIEKEKPSLDKFRELLSKVIDEIKNIDDNSPKTGFLENENILEISREDCKELLLKFQNNINHSDIIEKDNLNKFQKCFGTISFKHVKDVLRYIDEFDYLNASKSLVKLEEEVFGKENSFNS